MLEDRDLLRSQLMHFMQDHNLPEATLPSAAHLLKQGCNDIHYVSAQSSQASCGLQLADFTTQLTMKIVYYSWKVEALFTCLCPVLTGVSLCRF